jgi:hypothetical protein
MAQSLYFPTEDNEERKASVTDLHQDIAACDRAATAMRLDSRDLRWS